MATASVSLSDYADKLTVEARKRYVEKLRLNGEILPDPYLLKSGWSNDPVNWPDLTFGDIYNYLIDRQSLYTKETMKAFKSLEAYSYVVSGHVKEVLHHSVTDASPVCFLRAKVIPSQNVNSDHYAWVCLDKASAAIQFGHCTCMAGLDEVCSHVAAILFKVEIGVKLGLTQNSSTSKACEWNSCFRNEIEPLTIAELQNQIGIGKTRQKSVETTHASGVAELPPRDTLLSLYTLCPNAAFFTAIPPVSEDTKATESSSALPPLLSDLIDETVDMNTDQCEKIWSDYENKISVETCEKLEEATRSQSVCPLWYQHRKGRITGSKAHDVLVRRDTTPAENVVRGVMGYRTFYLLKKKAVMWGIETEDKARNTYITVQRQHHKDLEVRTAGFMIDHVRPYLGVSPDGLCQCKCCGKGSVEIKCPYKFKESSIAEALKDPNFCLNANMNLKQSHRYYTQIQLQMFVLRVSYCDFVTYTNKEIAVVRVSIDQEFCTKLEKKCKAFFISNVLPEIVTRKIEKEGDNDELEVQNKVFCICAQPAYGKMLQCDGEDCQLEKFHYACVNVRRKPRKQWYCQQCADKMNN